MPPAPAQEPCCLAQNAGEKGKEIKPGAPEEKIAVIPALTLRGGDGEAFSVRTFACLPKGSRPKVIRNSVEAFSRRLKEPVALGPLAGSCGLDYQDLVKKANPERDDREAREASIEVTTLTGIPNYREASRPAMRVGGNVVTAVLRKLPARLLEVGRRRMRMLLGGEL